MFQLTYQITSGTLRSNFTAISIISFVAFWSGVSFDSWFTSFSRLTFGIILNCLCEIVLNSNSFPRSILCKMWNFLTNWTPFTVFSTFSCQAFVSGQSERTRNTLYSFIQNDHLIVIHKILQIIAINSLTNNYIICDVHLVAQFPLVSLANLVIRVRLSFNWFRRNEKYHIRNKLIFSTDSNSFYVLRKLWNNFDFKRSE